MTQARDRRRPGTITRPSANRTTSPTNVKLKDTVRFSWQCDVCGSAVADGQGRITIDYVEVFRVEPGHDNHRLRSPSDPWDLLLSPLVRWHVYHRRCDPDLNGEAYWIRIEPCRTVADLCEWWLHLYGRRWLKLTDWRGFIRSRVLPQLKAGRP
jgi:hypothetical protein